MNIKEWILETQSADDIKEIAQHGCINGCCNDLIYYDDTTEFYDNHKHEIWDLLEQEADQFGYKSVFEFMGTWSDYAKSVDSDKSFSDYAKSVDSDKSFKNLLAWWSVENVCNQIIWNEEVA